MATGTPANGRGSPGSIASAAASASSACTWVKALTRSSSASMRLNDVSTSSRALISPEETSWPSSVTGRKRRSSSMTTAYFYSELHERQPPPLPLGDPRGGVERADGDLGGAAGPAVARPGPPQRARPVAAAGRHGLRERLARHRRDADRVGSAGGPDRR